MKTKFLSTLAIAVFFISAVAVAQPGSRQEKGDMPNHRKAMMMKKQKMANNDRPAFLTEEQKEQAKELRLETAKKIKPLKNELNELNARKKTLETADKANMTAIYKNIDEISAVRTEMAKIKAEQHQKFRAMLSEEQLLKFDEMKARKGKRGHANKKGIYKGKGDFERPQRG